MDQITNQEMIQVIFDPKGIHLTLSKSSSLETGRTDAAQVHHRHKIWPTGPNL